MTRRNHWAAGLTVLLAALLAAFALCALTGPRGARAAEATGDDYVYLRTDVLEDAEQPDNSNLPSGQSGAIIYTDTYSGGGEGVVNPIVLLQKDGDYVEYAFDLADDAETAVLSLNIGGSRRVEVKAAGESAFVKLTTESPAGNRSFEFYDLTEADALKSADNKFTLRVSFD